MNLDDNQKKAGALGLLRKLQQKSVAKTIKSIDWSKGSSNPIVVELDPTTVCNLACPDCISRDLLNHGFFSRDRFRKLAEELVDAGVRAVVLIGGGEPLMHPEIEWVIRWLGENGVKIGITTNGILLQKYIDVISEYASWVRVSMDAGTTKTFNIIRPSRSGFSQFEKIIENMRNFSRLKKGILGYSFMIYSEGKFRPNAGLNSLDDYNMLKEHEDQSEIIRTSEEHFFTNAGEIYTAACLAKDVGCDYFEVKPMYNKYHFIIEQNKEFVGMISQQLDDIQNLVTDTFKVLEATKLRDSLSGKGDVEKKEYTRCSISQLRTLVTPSGVYVCPYFRGREDKKIGDVNKMSFSDMWNGQERERVMSRLNPSVDCKMHCIRHFSNLMLEDAISGKHFDTIDDFDLFI